MKIAISYPPIVNQEGQKAMVSQNRNVQFFKKPTYLLPVIHAQAATWLRDLGYDVLWDDGNSQEKNFDEVFSGLFWVGNKAIDLGLADGIGSIHEIIKNRFGK